MARRHGRGLVFRLRRLLRRKVPDADDDLLSPVAPVGGNRESDVPKTLPEQNLRQRLSLLVLSPRQVDDVSAARESSGETSPCGTSSEDALQSDDLSKDAVTGTNPHHVRSSVEPEKDEKGVQALQAPCLTEITGWNPVTLDSGKDVAAVLTPGADERRITGDEGNNYTFTPRADEEHLHDSPCPWKNGDGQYPLLRDATYNHRSRDVYGQTACESCFRQNTPDTGQEAEATSLSSRSMDVDCTIHMRPPVIHESVRPHVHTIYEPRYTKSFHFHEHRAFIQPILDPSPTMLPVQHWVQDYRTGKLTRVSDEIGQQLVSMADRN